MNLDNTLGNVVRLVVLVFALYTAYTIRLRAVELYGKVIHEFDPWFNFRSTQYLVDHGLTAFLNWFDDQVWYPIGRHVGSTVYPGLMATSAFIFHTLPKLGLTDFTLTDICVYIPASFSIITCLCTAGIAYEATHNANAAVVTAAIMAISPAHLMRSVAGGYDNESVALPAIVMTFYFWLLSIRNPKWWPFGIVTALSYFYMVSTWGAYPFVLNMIGIHVVVLVITGRFSTHLHQAYSLFYFFGTLGALQLTIVGTAPLTSLEQLGPLGVFVGLQFLRLLYENKDRPDFVEFRKKVFMAAVGLGALGFVFLLLTGRLGAFSTRVKSLFIPHTKTGNPLVDSVAEHQATPPQYYYQYFHVQCFLAPVGVVALFFNPTDSKYFLAVYTLISYYFSQKMVRLVLLLSPAAAASAGIGLVLIANFVYNQLIDTQEKPKEKVDKTEKKEEQTEQSEQSEGEKQIKKKPAKAKIEATPENLKKIVAKKTPKKDPNDLTFIGAIQDHWRKLPKNVRQLLCVGLVAIVLANLFQYVTHSFEMSQHLSSTHLVMHARGRDGRTIVIDDFREAYWWLRDNTPEDSRVMAWWDYGYQINGIANRTSIADGNTWNHEHIALLGKCLVSPEKEAHKIARHLADYVLVWTTRFAGMQGDDLAKMPHMANIAGSVYPEVQRTGYFMGPNNDPTPLMKESLLYKLSTYRLVPGTPAPTLFKEVYTSKNNMVRIYEVLNVAPRTPFGKYAPQLKIGQFKQ